MSAAKVTILVPNYKTLELTKLCLRLLRKFTDRGLAKVLVIDNDSRDKSTEYLRTLSWIQLIERKAVPGESGPLAHSSALDLALAQVNTPYVLSIHTDTLVKNDRWLDFLLAEIEKSPDIAGIGSWKLEEKPMFKRALKSIEGFMQKSYFQLIGNTQHSLSGVGKNHYYLRSHCALYRTQVIRELHTGFSDGEQTAGKLMHKKMLDAGYQMIFLSSEKLSQYVAHINHATLILNPELGIRERSMKQGNKRMKHIYKEFKVEEVLQDVALDS